MSNLTVLKHEIVIVAINTMLSSNSFSICTIRDSAEVLGIRPVKEYYDVLRLLHCIDYNKIPKSIVEQIPDLIVKSLDNNEIFQFSSPSFKKPPEPTDYVDITVESVVVSKKKKLLSW